jgi:hypothetical protein
MTSCLSFVCCHTTQEEWKSLYYWIDLPESMADEVCIGKGSIYDNPRPPPATSLRTQQHRSGDCENLGKRPLGSISPKTFCRGEARPRLMVCKR